MTGNEDAFSIPKSLTERLTGSMDAQIPQAVEVKLTASLVKSRGMTQVLPSTQYTHVIAFAGHGSICTVYHVDTCFTLCLLLFQTITKTGLVIYTKTEQTSKRVMNQHCIQNNGTTDF